MSEPSATKAFVIGHPIAHSRSPLIHGYWLAELGLPGSYERIDVAPEMLAEFIAGFASRGFVGGNVTVPHKEAVFALLSTGGHELSDEARRLGAVNTLVALPEGRLRGHNTDGAGFVASVDEAVGSGWENEAGTAIVLGAGGAARAIVGALLDRGLRRIVVANRTPAKAEGLRRFAPERIEVVASADLAAPMREAGLLVNTTTLGMKGQPALDLDLADLPERAIVADIVYVPAETPLLAAARARGLRRVGGLGMLLHQAVPGFEAWFGHRPAVTPALRAAIEADIGAGA
ncbi:shikimate dehydrogenase [Enterovirga rhinocerotis]|uniref:Shikimate dehydrogenase (NADP(+)) n=1 Tax=Enterovirga rhinocerotis TaxID=1339210 RepID=A0A4V3DX34_9HYPH|nr:shikimate dehydrogenase [Enterovirga rhinocerotis]TDR87179.1 shikimate dehydrogenase [Enterovirga rhinocerotis]